MKGLLSFLPKFSKTSLGTSSHFPQFLILGLDGAGKTTLLYRLKTNTYWKTIAEDMAEMRKEKEGDDGKLYIEDPGYHYEEFYRGPFSFGVWDVPGTDAMRHVWPAFYRSIQIHGVLFVVDVSDKDDERRRDKVSDKDDERRKDERIALAKKELHILLNEDELRHSCFCVIFNKRGRREMKTQDEEDELSIKLGLHRLHPSCEWRVKVFQFDVLKVVGGPDDKEMVPMLEFMKSVLANPDGHRLRL